MTVYETQRILVAFFGWKPEAVRKLNVYEIGAWRKHFEQLE